MRFRREAMNIFQKNTKCWGRCSHVSWKVERVSFPQVTMRENKVTGRGDNMQEKEEHWKDWEDRIVVDSRGREEDITLLPSHRFCEALTGTWYSNQY